MLPLCLLSFFVTATAELLPGSCSFKDSMCGYTSDPDFLSWTLHPTGHFINAEVQEGRYKAVLLGPDVDRPDWSCLRMDIQTIGSSSLQVMKRTDGESFDQVLGRFQSSSGSRLKVNLDLQNSTETFKIVIEGKLGDDESSVSIYEIKVSDGYCIECDFGEDDLCGYTSQWNKHMNWRVGRAEEPTQKDRTGQYMYVDSTDTKNFQEVAKLVSPMTTAPMSGCLSFQYQQYEAGDHLFTLFSRDQAGHYQELWRAGLPDNNHVDWNPEDRVWIPGEVDLKAPYPVELVFEVAFNSPHGGYVVLDDISFSPDFCNASTEPTFDPSVANCDFESGYCQYVQTRTDGLWRRVTVKPNIYSSGDHTTGAGSFLLANSRLPSQSGYVSRLFGPPLPKNQKFCLKFFYSLRGLSGTDQVLAVYLFKTDGATPERIWSQNEKIRNLWIAAEQTIQSQKEDDQVVFISTCKNVWSCGSVGLDDIEIRLGDCSVTAPSLSAPSQCDFEAGLCEYTQDKEEDSADWTLSKGPTPTSYTGPQGDHTTGVGYYLHIEASAMLSGHTARLLSRSLRGFREPHCLLFYYHMYGSGTGQLSVRLQTSQEKENKVLWTRSGEQGISWHRASVNYQYDQLHQIVFEAIRGASVRSDIAIDDVSFLKGACREYPDDHIFKTSPSVERNDVQ